MSPSNLGRTPVMNETKKYRTWSISQASKRDKKRGITGFLCNQWLRDGEIVAEKSAGCLDLMFLAAVAGFAGSLHMEKWLEKCKCLAKMHTIFKICFILKQHLIFIFKNNNSYHLQYLPISV